MQEQEWLSKTRGSTRRGGGGGGSWTELTQVPVYQVCVYTKWKAYTATTTTATTAGYGGV